MNLIPLQSVPNQQLSTVLEENRYNISVKETKGVMGVTIVRNDITIIENVRATAGTLILPYLYEELGNFVFLNLDEDVIYYSNFGTSQNLYYLTAADLAALRSA